MEPYLIPDCVLEKHTNVSVPFSEHDGAGRAPRAGLSPVCKQI